MMTTNVYYFTNDIPTIQTDGTIVGAGASALEQALSDFYQSGGTGTKTLKFLAKGTTFSQISVETVDVVFNNDQVSIGAAVFDATATVAITAAISAAAGGAIPAIGVAVISSLLYSAIADEPVENFFDYLDGIVDTHITIKNSSGETEAGAFIKDGFSSGYTEQQAIADLLSRTSTDWPSINEDMQVVVEPAIGNSTTYKLYDPEIAIRLADTFFNGNIQDLVAFDGSGGTGGGNAVRFGTNAQGTFAFARANQANDTIWVPADDGTNLVQTFHPDDVVIDLSSTSAEGQLYLGTNSAEQVVAGGGDDWIYGAGGTDVLQGDAGNDWLFGGTGTDTAIYSGEFNDYTISITGDVKTTVTDNKVSDGNDGNDTLESIEKIQFSDGIYFQGRFETTEVQDPLANIDYATVETDGSVNIDVLANDTDPDDTGLTITSTGSASDGSVTIENDGTITYEPDAGFSGKDSFTYTITNGDGKTATATVNVVVGASGFVTQGTSGDNTLNGDGTSNTIDGQDGDDDIGGGAGNDFLFGGDGNDTIDGGADNDELHGGSGDDTLQGGAGNDYLYGGAGNDTFNGNAGNSHYFGGSGRDTYKFNMTTDSGWAGINENDASGVDIIELSNTDSGDRIEFSYNASTDQLDAYYYETSGSNFDFSFSVDASATNSGTGVEYVRIDGKSYLISNIVAAADLESNDTFVFDIADYEFNDQYPSILPDGTVTDGTALDIQNNGRTGIYDGYSSSVSTTIVENITEFYHPVTFSGNYDPENHPTTTFSAHMYIAEVIFDAGIDIGDIRITVDNQDNASIKIHLESLGNVYTYGDFEDGYTFDGYELSGTGGGGGGSSVSFAPDSSSKDQDGLMGFTISDAGAETSWQNNGISNTYFFETLSFANGDEINLRSKLKLEGTDLTETLYGMDRADYLYGYDGSDTIIAKGGADDIYGGAGDDTLNGGLGDDRYIFGSSDGNDEINEMLSEGTDTIVLGSAGVDDVTFDDVYMWISGNDLIVQHKSTYNYIQVDGSTISGTSASDVTQRIEAIEFSDGSLINLTSDMVIYNGRDTSHSMGGTNNGEVLNGNGGDDQLQGYGGDDILNGGTNNDYLYGGTGSDTLNGGADNDTLNGGLGNDRYIFGSSDGHDEINEMLSEGTDTIVLGSAGTDDVTFDDVYMWIDGSNDLVIQHKSTFDFVKVDGSTLHGSGASDVTQRIEAIEFSDGSLIDLTNDFVTYNGRDTSHSMDGTDNAEVLNGNGGDDQLEGHGGDDILNGGDGSDTLYGGDGIDWAVFSSAISDYYISDFTTHYRVVDRFGTEGTDNLYDIEFLQFSDGIYDGSIFYSSVINGSSASEMLIGTSSNDFILAETGDDVLVGGAGNDLLNGSSGNDTANYSAAASGIIADLSLSTVSNDGDGASDKLTGIENISGSAFSDSITGDAGDNVLSGNAGDDFLNGGSGNDTLDGGIGNDTVSYANDIDRVLIDLTNNIGRQEWNGSSGSSADTYVSIENAIGSNYNDIIHGGATGNLLQGGLGRDNIQGWAGNDTLEGGLDEDLIIGGDGDDIIRGGDGDEKSLWIGNVKQYDAGLYGGNGNDIIYGDAGDDAIYGDNDNDTLYGGDGNDYLLGGWGTDILYGEAGNDDLRLYRNGGEAYGGDGDDVLRGTADADIIYGGDGYDLLIGYAGNDTLVGGNGRDKFYATANANYDGGDGIIDDNTADEIFFSSYETSGVTVNISTGVISNANGDTGSITNIERVRGTNLVDDLTGDDTHNWLIGYGGDDIIRGGDGNDLVEGSDGDDILYGGAGDDKSVWENGIKIINASVVGGNGNDTMYGEAGSDRLTGNNGNDIMFGGVGEDYLYGNDDNDLLNGDEGLDYLYGGSGNDTLLFGDGNDSLWGNDGDDIFEAYEVISQDSDMAYAMDFVEGEDAIDISDLLSGYDPLNDAITDFVNIAQGSHTTVQVDRDGTGTAFGWDNIIRLQNNITISTDEAQLVTDGTLLVV